MIRVTPLFANGRETIAELVRIKIKRRDRNNATEALLTI